MVSPAIVFSMTLPVTAVGSIIYGSMLIKDKPTSAGTKIRATSGIAGCQYINAWKLKGRGCLPPSILNIDYTVSTNKLWLPNVRGVQGSFYPISPFSVNAGGINRGDFGIHFDPPGTKGSAGCIVLPDQPHWDIFREKIQQYRDDGVQSVHLMVLYTNKII